jgi:hypothetical protein
MWGALSDERTDGFVIYNCCWSSPAVILRSESRGTRDHILLSEIRDFLFIASYDSLGYGGGIRPGLHAGSISCSLFITSGRTEDKSPDPTVPLLLCVYPLLRKRVLTSQQRSGFPASLSVATERCLARRCLAKNIPAFRRHVTVPSFIKIISGIQK